MMTIAPDACPPLTAEMNALETSWIVMPLIAVLLAP
jgi:hypothetical protein